MILHINTIPLLFFPMLTASRQLADEIIRRLSHSSAGSEMNAMRPASAASMFDDVSVLLYYFQIHRSEFIFSWASDMKTECLLSLLLIPCIPSSCMKFYCFCVFVRPILYLVCMRLSPFHRVPLVSHTPHPTFCLSFFSFSFFAILRLFAFNYINTQTLTSNAVGYVLRAQPTA